VSKNPEQANVEAALHEMPVFPLPQVVLFPRALLPLHVFEPRYRAMLKDALATHKVLAMVLVVDGHERDAHGHPKIAEIAGAGAILEHQMLADGRSNIVLHGVSRVRLEELPFVPPYRRARGAILHDASTHVAQADRTALLAEATAFATEVGRRDPTFRFGLPPSLEPGAVADLCAHHLVIDAAARQRILEELDVAERVRLVTAELAVQRGAMRAGERGTLH
jgi:ATP-dependent Lon protease